jgi:hypothetical protein
LACTSVFIDFCRIINMSSEKHAACEDEELRCEEPDVSDKSEEEDVEERYRKFVERYQNIFRHRQLDKFKNAGGRPCDACKDLGGKGLRKSFSFLGLLGHAATKRGLRHSAYDEVLKQFFGEPKGAAAGEGGQRQQGSVRASMRAMRDPRAALQDTLGISRPRHW